MRYVAYSICNLFFFVPKAFEEAAKRLKMDEEDRKKMVTVFVING